MEVRSWCCWFCSISAFCAPMSCSRCTELTTQPIEMSSAHAMASERTVDAQRNSHSGEEEEEEDNPPCFRRCGEKLAAFVGVMDEVVLGSCFVGVFGSSWVEGNLLGNGHHIGLPTLAVGTE